MEKFRVIIPNKSFWERGIAQRLKELGYKWSAGEETNEYYPHEYECHENGSWILHSETGNLFYSSSSTWYRDSEFREKYPKIELKDIFNGTVAKVRKKCYNVTSD